MPIDVALAVDIGGTKVDAALVDATGRIVPGSRHRTASGPGQTPDTFADAIATACGRSASHAERAAGAGSPEYRIVGVGVGSAGPLLGGGTRISPLNMPGIRDFPLAPVVEPFANGGPVRIALDGRCIAMAEHRFGALRGVRNGIAMVVSTGIGGGIVLDGRVVHGASANAGHVGQVWVRRPGAGDPVGATVEAVAAGPATVRWALEHGWRGPDARAFGAPGQDTPGEGTPGLDGRALAADYRAGHPVALRAVRRSAEAVGHAIAACAALLDLEVVAIGGGFSRVADDYVQLVEAAAHAVAVLPAARDLRVVRAALGDDAPLVGAAVQVHEPAGR
ncbi:ROK family protein [Agromyces aurantiacus]|uniref:ROK family protein n=1 Tax=Agromyces aurantiacus TaxID=165814 RepID=A0ABV9R487_9MICO|nr:ROK family protein [Agromyces aurantiacus]MBM7503633.1 glucokinase [Agromyces aurantiacus]